MAKPRIPGLRTPTRRPPEAVLLASWNAYFLREDVKPGIYQATAEGRSVPIDWNHLERHHSPDFARGLLDRPDDFLDAAATAAQELNLHGDQRPVRVHVHNLGVEDRVRVRQLRAEHTGHLVAVEGIVKRTTDVEDFIWDAFFKCLRCDAVIQEPQTEYDTVAEPLQCYEDQGGCGHSTGFRLDLGRTVRVDSQRIDIQEAPEGLSGSDQPARLTAYLRDDLCGRVRPGDRVLLTGIVRAAPRRKGTAKQRKMQRFFTVVNIDLQEATYEDVVVKPEDEQAIVRLSRDVAVYEQLAASLAPEIYGWTTEKESVVLQLFGGVDKQRPGRARLRGDIHVLMVGDPGIAKSVLLRAAASLSPRGLMATGKGSSAAGLTAAVMRDEESGSYTYEAGALVLGDGGLVAIDELDKMGEEDRDAILGALEQGVVTIRKAGVQVDLNSRCSVLGAANPKDGRFDSKFTALAEKIDLPPPLLSRFDLIWPMVDRPHVEQDTAVGKHVLGAHRAGEIRRYREVHPDGAWTREDEARAAAATTPPIPPDLLRKYIAHARRSCIPVLTQDAIDHLLGFYVEMRRKALDGGPLPITARQLEALVRLTEASARVRLSHEATAADAERAMRLTRESLGRATGGDIDKLMAGTTSAGRAVHRDFLALVGELQEGHAHGAHRDEIVARAKANFGLTAEDTEELLEQFRLRSELWCPRQGWYKRTKGGA